jgi:hypothetical protein
MKTMGMMEERGGGHKMKRPDAGWCLKFTHGWRLRPMVCVRGSASGGLRQVVCVRWFASEFLRAVTRPI